MLKKTRKKLYIIIIFLIIIEILTIGIMNLSPILKNREEILSIKSDISIISTKVNNLKKDISYLNDKDSSVKIKDLFRDFKFIFGAGIRKIISVKSMYSSNKHQYIYKVKMEYYAKNKMALRKLLFLFFLNPHIDKIISLDNRYITVLVNLNEVK